MLLRLSYLGILSLASTSAAADFDQKLLGVTYLKPSNLGKAEAIKSAAASISKELQNALNTGISKFGNFTAMANSLSATVVSVQDAAPFLDFQYTAANLNVSGGSTARVTGESIYRIGSVSKLFTVYTLLLNGGEKIWDQPVTDYLPELRGALSQPEKKSSLDYVQWDQVTVGALASQLAGLGRDVNNADLASQGFPAAQAGMPQLPSDQIPTCAGNNSQAPCSRKEFFDVLVKRSAVSMPYTTPTYSNAAYRLLGYVIEAVTGTTYHEAVAKSVTGPLNLKKTTTLSPSGNGVGVIPQGNSGWGRALGDEVSTGGLYSTSHDLADLGRAILSNKQLSPLQTRRWMKPHAHTASLSFSVGAPWEIWRTRSQVKSGYVVDVYVKSGSDDQYQALLVVVPEFDIAASILCAGPDAGKAIDTASEVVLQAFLPALDKTAQSQTAQRFSGRYVSSDKKNSSLVLTTDAQPGLLVKQWLSNGVDVQAAAQAYADSTQGGHIQSMRLYPMISSPSRVSFRAVFDTVPVGFDPAVPQILKAEAGQWGQVDQLMYGGISVDDFVFQLDGKGVATSVQPRVLRDTLKRA